MALSTYEKAVFQCAICTRTTEFANWQIVDAIERPDLVDRLARGRLFVDACSACGHAQERNSALVVARLSPALSFLAFVPDQTFAQEDKASLDQLEEKLRPYVDRLREEGIRTSTVFGAPPVVLPFEAANIVLKRQLEADLQDTVAAVDEVSREAGSRLAQQYGAFLDAMERRETERRLHLAVMKLTEVQDLAGFRGLLDECPELLTRGALNHMDYVISIISDDGYADAFRAQKRLLELVPTRGVEKAWAQYWDMGTQSWERSVGEKLQELQRSADSAGPPEERLKSLREGLELARHWDVDELVGWFSYALATALLGLGGPSTGRHVEDALAHFEVAFANATNDQERGLTLLNMAVAWGMRLFGDPSENVERCIDANRKALELVARQENPNQWAMIHTNLAVALQRRRYGTRAENLMDALGHCHEALAWRSPERCVEDWAYTELNRGVVHGLLEELGHSTLDEAAAAYEKCIRELSRTKHSVLLGRALGNLARVDRRRAVSSPTPRGRVHHLRQAHKLLRQSMKVLRRAGDLEWTRAALDLGRLSFELGKKRRGTRVLERALAVLRPDVWPSLCHQVAASLAWVASEKGDWDAAAAAYKDAVEASELTYLERTTGHGRYEVLLQTPNLNRWAAYALARVGRLRESVEVLEVGRLRELSSIVRQEEADLDKVAEIDPSLRDAYTQTREAMRDAGGPPLVAHWTPDMVLSPSPPEAIYAKLAEIVRAIRRLPGLAGFLRGPTIEDIAAAAESAQPIVYVNATPRGSVLLVVWNPVERPSGDLIDAIFIDGFTSTDLIRRLMKGFDEGVVQGGFLFAQAGMTDDLHDAIEEVLPLLGEVIHPLHRHLAGRGVVQFSCIAMGPLGLVPIAAAEWTDEEGHRVDLVQTLQVSMAPSAYLLRVCRERARERDGVRSRLMGIANPLPASPQLPGAEAELAEVSHLFEGRAQTRTRTEATKEFLESAASDATHLHLACHARSDFHDFRKSGLSLANGEDFGLNDILALGPLSARVVVLSACQTGVFPLSELSEEVLALGTAFLAAGAAGVIASLWEIDDFATALLVTRLYEELLSNSMPSPANGLRTAQLWLRSLSEERERSYVMAHEHLRHQFLRRVRERSLPGQRGVRGRGTGASKLPYADPIYWAAFVLVGY